MAGVSRDNIGELVHGCEAGFDLREGTADVNDGRLPFGFGALAVAEGLPHRLSEAQEGEAEVAGDGGRARARRLRRRPGDRRR